ncbi:MAG: thioredoxin family protein [Spirochaetaceae bacterium]|nr:MAG: thioredoxin family protein [Spirochaetaceae bacterium]
MAMINDKDRKVVGDRLSKLTGSVKLMMFSQDMECQFCKETRELVEEVAALSDKISVEVKDFMKQEVEAKKLGIDKIPAVAVFGEGDKDYGIRFYGIPAGYEFMSLLESIEIVSKGESGLSASGRERLKGLNKPVHLQVFVTPTCPYCPRAVVQAFRMAVESPNVTASMVEATEFPHLANKYQVSGVPHTVIGDSPQPMIGAYPEAAALDLILNAVA